MNVNSSTATPNFIFKTINDSGSIEIDYSGTSPSELYETNLNYPPDERLKLLQERTICDAIKDYDSHPTWLYNNGVLPSNATLKPFSVVESQSFFKDEYHKLYTRFRNNIIEMKNLPKNSLGSSYLQFDNQEAHFNYIEIFSESGFSSHKLFDTPHTKYITSASSLDPAGKPAGICDHNQHVKVCVYNPTIHIHPEFMNKIGLDVIGVNDWKTIRKDAEKADVFVNQNDGLSVNIQNINIRQPSQRNVYTKGNNYKNTKINKEKTKSPEPNVDEIKKYIFMKELGDVAQVFMYLAFVHEKIRDFPVAAEKNKEKNKCSMITTDLGVYILNILLGLGSICTGTRQNVKTGNMNLYIYNPIQLTPQEKHTFMFKSRKKSIKNELTYMLYKLSDIYNYFIGRLESQHAKYVRNIMIMFVSTRWPSRSGYSTNSMITLINKINPTKAPEEKKSAYSKYADLFNEYREITKNKIKKLDTIKYESLGNNVEDKALYDTQINELDNIYIGYQNYLTKSPEPNYINLNVESSLYHDFFKLFNTNAKEKGKSQIIPVDSTDLKMNKLQKENKLKTSTWQPGKKGGSLKGKKISGGGKRKSQKLENKYKNYHNVPIYEAMLLYYAYTLDDSYPSTHSSNVKIPSLVLDRIVMRYDKLVIDLILQPQIIKQIGQTLEDVETDEIMRFSSYFQKLFSYDTKSGVGKTKSEVNATVSGDEETLSEVNAPLSEEKVSIVMQTGPRKQNASLSKEARNSSPTGVEGLGIFPVGGSAKRSKKRKPKQKSKTKKII